MSSTGVSLEESVEFFHTVLYANQGILTDDVTIKNLFYILGVARVGPDFGPFERMGMTVTSKPMDALLAHIRLLNDEFEVSFGKGSYEFAVHHYTSIKPWSPKKTIDLDFRSAVQIYMSMNDLAARCIALALYYKLNRLPIDEADPWKWITFVFSDYYLTDTINMAKELYTVYFKNTFLPNLPEL